MKQVILAHEADFAGWRDSARHLLAESVAPQDASWAVGQATDLFGETMIPPLRPAGPGQPVPLAFVELAQSVVLANDPARFALLYGLLWRMTHGEPQLMKIPIDPMLHRAEALAKSVRRDIHKMRAFLRFTEVRGDDDTDYVAWFEPEHFIVDANAGFFQRRFTAMRWFILTPYRSLHWDGQELYKSGGADKSLLPPDDEMHDYWNTYFSSIFNPARLKVKAMTSEMPRKYWKNMPEAALIPALTQSAARRTAAMIDRVHAEPHRSHHR